MTQRIVLSHHCAPGDTVVLTGFVRDLALTYPGRYTIGVHTSAMDLWRHNPHIDHSISGDKRLGNIEHIRMKYNRGIRDQNYEPVHFLPYFHRDFEEQKGVKVPLRLPYPDLHLSPEERNIPLIEGRYWVLITGGKSDFPAKAWASSYFQEVVHGLAAMGLGAVQAGSTSSGHWHPPLKSVINLVGRTNLRDLMRLIHHADGLICGVTCAMHMAAALQRPCICLAGGREAWWWEAYVRENKGLAPVQALLQVPHKFLHTIGLLDCCRQHGCWVNKVVPLNKDKSLCKLPTTVAGQPLPTCMDMIKPAHVLEAVMQYYEDKSLPPISAAATTHVPVIPPPAAPPPRLLDLFGDLPLSPPNGNGNGHKQDKPHTATAQLQLPPGVTPAEFFQKAKIRVNAAAKMEGRGMDDKPVQVATAPGTAAAKPAPPKTAAAAPRPPHYDNNIFDHPDVGGIFTAFILFYGPEQFFKLHQRCLTTLLATVPAGRLDLRVGSNALNAKSLAMVNEYVRQGHITKHYRHDVNAFKYPVMREMFRDPSQPIRTKWVLWFDDDSICERSPTWLHVLCEHIVEHHRKSNAHMFGDIRCWTPGETQRAWYAGRPWHRQRPWRLSNGQPAPNGSKILFCVGGFWALTSAAIRTCDIPDPDIGHNGGDIAIGEQLYQGGYQMRPFNSHKEYVHTSSVPRRGPTLAMPGTVGHQNVVKQVRQLCKY